MSQVQTRAGSPPPLKHIHLRATPLGSAPLGAESAGEGEGASRSVKAYQASLLLTLPFTDQEVDRSQVPKFKKDGQGAQNSISIFLSYEG